MRVPLNIVGKNATSEVAAHRRGGHYKRDDERRRRLKVFSTSMVLVRSPRGSVCKRTVIRVRLRGGSPGAWLRLAGPLPVGGLLLDTNGLADGLVLAKRCPRRCFG